MEDRILTEQESLNLIEKMMQKTKSRLPIGLAINSLISGYAVILISLAIEIAWRFQIGWLKYIWIVLPFLIPMLIIWFHRNNKYGEAINKDYTGISLLWKIIGIICIPLTFLFIAKSADFASTIFIFVVGIGYLYANITIKFKLGTLLSIIGIVIGYISTFVSVSWSIPLFALSFLFMSIIPGHILLSRSNKIQ